MNNYDTNEQRTIITDIPIKIPVSSANTNLPQKRKRHQRKPTRKKPVQLLDSPKPRQSMTISVKDEPFDVEDNTVIYTGIHDDKQSATWKKSELLLETGGNPSNEATHDSQTLLTNSSTYKWLHQAFRSLMSSQSQINNIELIRQQHSLSPKSGTNFKKKKQNNNF